MKKISQEKPRHKNWNALQPYLLAAVALAVLLIGFIAARYIVKWDGTQIATTDDFFFTSDMLKENKPEYNIDPKADSFKINLYNYADVKRVTPQDITYTVEADQGTADSAGGTLAGSNESTAAITITPSSGATQITVTVTTTKPYKKTISAIFTRSEGSYYMVEDKDDDRAAVLTITCTYLNAAREIAINLPADVVPDVTDNRITKSGNTYIFRPQSVGVYSLVLFKSNAADNLSKAKTLFDDTITIN